MYGNTRVANSSVFSVPYFFFYLFQHSCLSIQLTYFVLLCALVIHIFFITVIIIIITDVTDYYSKK